MVVLVNIISSHDLSYILYLDNIHMNCPYVPDSSAKEMRWTNSSAKLLMEQLASNYFTLNTK